LTSILPLSGLFKNQAFYPKRYFDEIMVEERGKYDSPNRKIIDE